MELNFEGTIIGVISTEEKKEAFTDEKVQDILSYKKEDALKMVGLDASILDKSFNELSSRDKNKVILASKLHNKEIILYDFSKGMLKKDLDFFKRLFKRIASYNKKIILYSHDAHLFLNCVDKIYVINNNNIVYETTSLFDPTIYIDMDAPEIVKFIYMCEDLGIRLDEYTDINDLIKAIYRIKS